MSINWVMLSASDGFTPLAGEQKLYTSPPRTSLSLQSLNKYPGKEPYHIQSASGIIHLTNRRIIYLPSTPSPAFQSFAAPILNLHDTHVDTPWFGPNTWTALVQPVSGGGIPPQHAALELKLTFKEGGAFDFSSAYERVKERLQQAVDVARESGHIINGTEGGAAGAGRGGLAGVDMGAVHLDQLPAYEPGPTGGPVGGGETQTAAGQQARMENVSEAAAPAAQPFSPPADPPPGYEEVQRDSVADELERRLRDR